MSATSMICASPAIGTSSTSFDMPGLYLVRRTRSEPPSATDRPDRGAGSKWRHEEGGDTAREVPRQARLHEDEGAERRAQGAACGTSALRGPETRREPPALGP